MMKFSPVFLFAIGQADGLRLRRPASGDLISPLGVNVIADENQHNFNGQLSGDAEWITYSQLNELPHVKDAISFPENPCENASRRDLVGKRPAGDFSKYFEKEEPTDPVLQTGIEADEDWICGKANAPVLREMVQSNCLFFEFKKESEWTTPLMEELLLIDNEAMVAIALAEAAADSADLTTSQYLPPCEDLGTRVLYSDAELSRIFARKEGSHTETVELPSGGKITLKTNWEDWKKTGTEVLEKQNEHGSISATMMWKAGVQQGPSTVTRHENGGQKRGA